MPKKAVELGPLQVSRLTTPGLHAVGGVAGLRLQVSPSGARSWILRTTVADRRSDLGLGGYPDVTLAGARDSAREVRAKIAAGIDPVAETKAKRSALQAAAASAWTFDQCATTYIAAKSPEWSNDKHVAQWTATLKTYAYPVLGKLLVRDIGLPHVLEVLRPIWHSKTETATRVRSRMESVLDWAATSGYREGLNPARWKGHLDKLLPAPGKISKVEHHSAIPYADVAGFMKKLRQAEGMGARALEFAILTAARSGEVRGATWAEIDLDAGLWIVPADRMKSGREHRVPLSDAATALLRALPKIEGSDFVFASSRGGQLSDMTLSAVMRRMAVAAVPHGFRSSFRDWCAEQTNYPREVAEMALAHTIGDKVEAAYRRGDLFEKRRTLMTAWAKFIDPTPPKGNVRAFRAPKVVAA